MDGKKKLEKLVSITKRTGPRNQVISDDTIRSISDAYKAMEERAEKAEAENERLRSVMETAAEMAERPTYNELEVGFRHHPLRPDEIRQRLEDTCRFIASDLRRNLEDLRHEG